MRTRSARVRLAALFTAGVFIVTACSQDPAPRPRSEPPAAATPPAVSSSAPEETPTAPAEGYRGRLPALLNPPFALPRPRPVVEAVYEFAARHPEVLSYVPCFCGCERSGHADNADCFVSGREPDGRPRWDLHGMG